jgi:large subunit ribosomal protein L30
MAETTANKTLRITLVRSPIGFSYKHKATVRALGLRKIRQTVEQSDTPVIRGMLAKVARLVKIEETG